MDRRSSIQKAACGAAMPREIDSFLLARKTQVPLE
jgi:hypothetical protein